MSSVFVYFEIYHYYYLYIFLYVFPQKTYYTKPVPSLHQIVGDYCDHFPDFLGLACFATFLQETKTHMLKRHHPPTRNLLTNTILTLSFPYQCPSPEGQEQNTKQTKNKHNFL